MLEHRMMRKVELAMNANAARLGLHALELDAVVELVDLDAIEHAVKVKMPPRAAEFAVGRDFKPNLLLLFDDFFDFTVFDLAELRGTDLAFLPLRPRLLQRRGS